MATPLHTPARRVSLRRAGLALAATFGVLLATVPASAEPGTPATAAQAAQLVAERGHQLEVVTEEFNEAREALAAQQATAAAAAAELEKATAILAEAQQSVRGVARSAYTGESLGSFQAMMTSDSADEFLGRVTTLQTIAGHQNGVLGRAAEAGVVAARVQVERMLDSVPSYAERPAAFRALDARLAPLREATLGSARFGVAVVDLSARVDLNRADAATLRAFLAQFAGASRAAAIAAALGEPVRFVEQSPEEARTRMLGFMPEPVVEGTLAIIGAPTPAEQRISPDVARVLGRPPHAFADWARRSAAAFR